MAKEAAYIGLSIQTVKKVLSPEEIQAQLDVWYAQEEKGLDRKANMMSDRVPLPVRQKEVRENLDREFAQLKAEYGI